MHSTDHADDEEAQDDEDYEALRRACLLVLGSNFDAVQIIATRHDAEDQSVLRAKGLGNYYARRGAVQEWLEAMKRG